MGEWIFAGGTVVRSTGVEIADIRVSGDTISAVGPHLPAEGADVIDCRGRWVFPGLVDPHTHMGIPIKQVRSRDDFASGSRAALQGGVTTLIDFTVWEARQSLEESIRQRQAEAASSLADVSLHANITRLESGLADAIETAFSLGVVSFKVFTTYREAGMMLEYPQIREVAEILAVRGGVLQVHAEDDRLIQEATAPLVAAGSASPRDHGRSRPVAAEVEAIRRLGTLHDVTGCPVYIVHLSSAAGWEAAREENLLMETCPQYLLLDERSYEAPDGHMFVASPPLRSPEERDRLWEGIKDGSIAAVGTDHCPFCRRDKPAGLPFQDIPNGIGGVETAFPLLLNQWIQRDLPLPRLVDLMATRPAQIFGLAPRKGDLQPGADADLVIVDPGRRKGVEARHLLTRADWSAYEGMEAIFPEQVWRRGTLMVREGKVVNDTPGRFLPATLPDRKVLTG